MPKEKKESFPIIAPILTAIVFAIQMVLGWVQIKSGTGDWLLHLERAWSSSAPQAVTPSYSLMDLVIRGLKLFSNSWIPPTIFVSCLAAGTIVTGAVCIQRIVPELRDSISWLVSFIAYIVLPVYCPSVNSMMAIGNQGVGVWHNSTYTGVKLFIPILLLNIHAIFMDGVKVKNYIGFMIALFLGTWMKPSIFLCAAPAIFTMWLLALIQKKMNMQKTLALGGTLLPTILILFMQYRAVYGEKTSDAGSIAIVPFYIFQRGLAEHPILAIVQSLLFPVFILISLFRYLRKEKAWAFCWFMVLFAYLEMLLFVETGERIDHGNWAWGALLGNYGLFLLAIAYFVQQLLQKEYKKDLKAVLWSGTGMIFLGWHFLSGMIYIVRCFVEKNLWI